MKALLLTIVLLGSAWCLNAQSPVEASLPLKLDTLAKGIVVNHFPSPVHAVMEMDKNDTIYIWKHNTSIMAVGSDIEVTACGAYIFYNNQWNLRAEYSQKDFAKFFNCPKGMLRKGQPYTFVENWRHDSRLYGGWALWYFEGTNQAGQQVGGYAYLETTGQLFDATSNF